MVLECSYLVESASGMRGLRAAATNLIEDAVFDFEDLISCRLYSRAGAPATRAYAMREKECQSFRWLRRMRTKGLSL